MLITSCVLLLEQLDQELTQEESVLAMQMWIGKRSLVVTMIRETRSCGNVGKASHT